LEDLMQQVVLLVWALLTIMLMNDIHLAMAGDHSMRRATGQKSRVEQVGQLMRLARDRSPAPRASGHHAMGQLAHRLGEVRPTVAVDVNTPLGTGIDLPSWRALEGAGAFPRLRASPADTSEGGEEDTLTEDHLLLEDEPDVAQDEGVAPSEVVRDWRGLGRDTAFFLGYQAIGAGIWFLTPESVSQWTAEQRRTSLQKWWENVRHPQWDPDTWYVNYLGHPYFGAIGYIRARERHFGAFGGFWYAALLSGLYEFGIEAMFERPSYQDLIVTPVGGLLVGALLFEPIREYILRKPELRWYDHIPLALTDPLGVSNSIFERLLGIQTDIRVQLRLPTSTPHMRFDEPTARSLNRPLEQHRQAPGIGIEFVFGGRNQAIRLP
jgi:Domain of unknown function (DUF3943)